MLRGIVFQTVAITAATLLAFWIGSADPPHVHYAETMAFVTLSISELLRAYTARSEYYPLVKIGVFTNRWMNLAVLASLALILGAVYVPFLNGIFDTEPLGWAQWVEILPLILIPSVVAEVTKVVFAPHRKKTS
ncbi:MAG: cation-translocating P-type ATPase C-terminal domain-containing protein, partial [Chloroflexus sp.]|nr:cation-translocating P-type ATPase C-terminal domain-containing protein [Chloroflexus sp.]